MCSVDNGTEGADTVQEVWSEHYCAHAMVPGISTVSRLRIPDCAPPVPP